MEVGTGFLCPPASGGGWWLRAAAGACVCARPSNGRGEQNDEVSSETVAA